MELVVAVISFVRIWRTERSFPASSKRDRQRELQGAGDWDEDEDVVWSFNYEFLKK